MGTDNYDYTTEISALGSKMANAYFNLIGVVRYPIEPELIAEKYFGLQIVPIAQLRSGVGVRSGLDTTQSVLFIDERIYMQDATQYIARQSIGHEIGHIIYDANRIRASVPRTPQEAYDLHVAMGQESRAEYRANSFAGAFLVPRRELLIQVSMILKKSLSEIQLSNPEMTMETLVAALSGVKLSNYFGVSTDVIRWRLHKEGFYKLIGVTPAMQLKDVEVHDVLTLCETEAEREVRLSDRMKHIIPAKLLTQLE